MALQSRNTVDMGSNLPFSAICMKLGFGVFSDFAPIWCPKVKAEGVSQGSDLLVIATNGALFAACGAGPLSPVAPMR